MGAPRLACAAAVALILGILAGHASGATSAWVPVVDGLNSPVYVTSAPGDPSTLYVVEQPGVIATVKGGHVTGTFLDIRSLVKSGGEQGLLSMAFSPRYATNHTYYVSYTDVNGDSRVAEYHAGSTTGKIILAVHQPYPNHNGGQLQFDRRGYLYIGFGDGGSEGDPNQTSESQGTRLGKLLRSATTSPNGSWKEVGLGLRNPWRFSFDAHDNLWIGDVGQDKWEEVDFRPAAKLDRLANYGWSRYEGTTVYDASHRYTNAGDKVIPVLVYSHSVGCSVTGGFVHGTRYYYGDFCKGTVWSFPVGASGRAGSARVSGSVPSLSGFGVDGNGTLYATSLSGTLYRLR